MKVEIISDEAVSPNLAAWDAASVCAFTLATVAANGDIFCAYRRGTSKHGPDGVFLVQRSSDGGRTWSDPLTVFDGRAHHPPQSVLAGGLGSVGDTLLAVVTVVEMQRTDAYVFGEEAMHFPWRIYCLRSRDGGMTWSSPREIDAAPLLRAGGGGKPFLLADGGLCVLVEYTLPAGPQATAGVFTHDLGETFSKPHIFAADEKLSLCDARVIRLRDGTYRMHLWTFVHQGEQTIDVHQSRSADGKNWSKAVPLGIHGQISAPLELPSGLMVAVNNHRQTPQGSQLWWSHDGGASWNDRPIQMWDPAEGRMVGAPAAARRVSRKEQVWDELRRFSFGTPDLSLLGDGSVLLNYWATLDNIIHIRACRFRIEGNKGGQAQLRGH